MGPITDREMIALLAVALAILQFLYRLFDKKDNKEILQAIKAGIDGFSPHIERTKHMKGMMKDLVKWHQVADEDGRPLIYMPKEIIETQRELVKLTHTVATTQAHMARLLEKYEDSMSKSMAQLEAALILHSDACKNQFHELDKKMLGGKHEN